MAPGMALGRLSPSEVGRRNLRVAWQKLFFFGEEDRVSWVLPPKLHKFGCSSFWTWELSALWSRGVTSSPPGWPPALDEKVFFPHICSSKTVENGGLSMFIVSKIFPQLRRISDPLTHLSWEFSNVQSPCPKAIGALWGEHVVVQLRVSVSPEKTGTSDDDLPMSQNAGTLGTAK